MKIRLLLPFIAFTAAILACSNTFPFIWEEERRYSGTTIMNLEVSPPSGTEDFNLEVTYSVFWVPDKTIPSIDCIYTAPDGTTAEIGSIDMLRHIGSRSVETPTVMLPFFVPAEEDGSHAGIYIANCRTENDSSTQSTTFEVVKEDKKTPVLTVTNSPLTYSGAPQAAVIQSAILPDGIVAGTILNVLYNGSTTVPTNAGTYAVTADFAPSDTTNYTSLTASPAGDFVIQKAAPAALTRGKIIFDFARAESSMPGAGGYAAEVTNLCVPEVTIADDGTINGECEQSGVRGHLVTSVNLTTMVIGQVDPSGKVTFTYEVSEIGLPVGSWRVDYSGSGTLTADGKATGTADFAYTCNSGSENLFWCRIVPGKDSLTSDAFSGTIPWKLEAAP